MLLEGPAVTAQIADASKATSVPFRSIDVKLRALRFAPCMRAPGVSTYPDPIFHGGAEIEKPLTTYGINPDSPVVQNAGTACGRAG